MPAHPFWSNVQSSLGTAGFNVLTGGESTPEEHVEEVLRGDVRLEAAVEVCVTVSVPSGVELLVPVLVVLLPLLRVAQHRVGVANGWNMDN